MIIHLNSLYLDRLARTVSIVQDRGEAQRWRWLTTRGYYVQADGRATARPGGESNADLVRDITPTPGAVAGMDSTMQALA